MPLPQQAAAAAPLPQQIPTAPEQLTVDEFAKRFRSLSDNEIASTISSRYPQYKSAPASTLASNLRNMSDDDLTYKLITMFPEYKNRVRGLNFGTDVVRGFGYNPEKLSNAMSSARGGPLGLVGPHDAPYRAEALAAEAAKETAQGMWGFAKAVWRDPLNFFMAPADSIASTLEKGWKQKRYGLIVGSLGQLELGSDIFDKTASSIAGDEEPVGKATSKALSKTGEITDEKLFQSSATGKGYGTSHSPTVPFSNKKWEEVIAPRELLTRYIGDRFHILDTINRAIAQASAGYEHLKSTFDTPEEPNAPPKPKVIDATDTLGKLRDLYYHYNALLAERAPETLKNIGYHLDQVTYAAKKAGKPLMLGWEETKQLKSLADDAAHKTYGINNELSASLKGFARHLDSKLSSAAESRGLGVTYKDAKSLFSALSDKDSAVVALKNLAEEKNAIAFFKNLKTLRDSGSLMLAQEVLKHYGLDAKKLVFDLNQARRVIDMDKTSIFGGFIGRHLAGMTTESVGAGYPSGYGTSMVLTGKWKRFAALRKLDSGGFFNSGMKEIQDYINSVPKTVRMPNPTQAPPQSGGTPPAQASPSPSPTPSPTQPSSPALLQSPPRAPTSEGGSPSPIPSTPIPVAVTVPPSKSILDNIRDNLKLRTTQRAVDVAMSRLSDMRSHFASEKAYTAYLKSVYDSLKNTEGELMPRQRRKIYQSPIKLAAERESGTARQAKYRQKGVAEQAAAMKSRAVNTGIVTAVSDLEDEIKSKLKESAARNLLRYMKNKYPDHDEYKQALVEYLEDFNSIRLSKLRNR